MTNRQGRRNAMLLMALPVAISAQGQVCAQGAIYSAVHGAVHDSEGAAIPGALIKPAKGQAIVADNLGRFTVSCAASSEGKLTVAAPGFETAQVRSGNDGKDLVIVLRVARVYTTVEAGPSDGSSESGDAAHTLSAEDVRRLADDPDDLRQQLQVLAAAAGGAPGQATITVDGFQNSSSLPPKSTIASIRIAPDMFSAEYASPPYAGGRVEILTKPGLNAVHGAVFYTNSNGSVNATNPFAATATPASKQRYGFELSAPLLRNRLDGTAALERRDITEFSVVNAVVLDSGGNRLALRQTVDAPQQLWVGSFRGDLQATRHDTLTASYTANVNSADNQGIGGLILPAAGFGSNVSEYDLRISNNQTIGATAVHQSRVGLSWKTAEQTPLSSAPGLNVSGFFVGGGSTAGHRRARERDLEIDEGALVDRGRHAFNVGVQAFGFFVRNTVPDTFNGSFLFGGGSATALDTTGQPTGTTTAIDGLEQYRRATCALAGGAPTLFQLTQGNAQVNFTQWRVAAFLQDTIKLRARLSLSAGLRYAAQTSPDSVANVSPRLGLSWAPDRRSRWILHARAGLFSTPIDTAVSSEAYRLNGFRQTEQIVYSPNYSDPMESTGDSLAVSTVRQLAAHPLQTHALQTQLGVEHDLPRHWNAQASLFYADAWNDLRTRNINAPEVPASVGALADPLAALRAPRPLGPNANVLQYENTAHLRGSILFAGVNQHSYRRFGLFFGYLHMNLHTDAGGPDVLPQSSYSKLGEAARPDWQATHRLFLVGTVSLPGKLEFSTETDASSGLPYNITTGTDSNGDGALNDRPSFATASGAGVYSSRFGLLTSNTVNGDVPRNFGTMPWLAHIDINLSRTFSLDDKLPSSRSFTLNARAANLLNHTNVTGVGTVVSSPTFSQPLVAEAARRCELGIRFTF